MWFYKNLKSNQFIIVVITPKQLSCFFFKNIKNGYVKENA
jgi:hypothetical protein